MVIDPAKPGYQGNRRVRLVQICKTAVLSLLIASGLFKHFKCGPCKTNLCNCGALQYWRNTFEAGMATPTVPIAWWQFRIWKGKTKMDTCPRLFWCFVKCSFIALVEDKYWQLHGNIKIWLLFILIHLNPHNSNLLCPHSQLTYKHNYNLAIWQDFLKMFSRRCLTQFAWRQVADTVTASRCTLCQGKISTKRESR